MPTTVELNPVAIKRMLTSPDGPVVRDMLRRGLRVEAAAKRRCKVDSGRLRSSITHHYVHATANGIPVVGVRVGTNVEYATWVQRGTGTYGPHQSPIVPTRAKVLRFTGRSGQLVFARSVAGQRGKPFLIDALIEGVR